MERLTPPTGDLTLRVEEWIEIHRLASEGMNKTEIGRTIGRHRDTVDRYLKQLSPPSYGPRRAGPSILTPFMDEILAEVKQAHEIGRRVNCRVLHRKINRRGYQGSLSNLQKTVRKLCDQFPKAPIVRYETEPGKQMQMDWGEGFWIVTPEGRRRKVYCFAAILGYSRMRYVEFTYDMKVETLIQCHLNAFEYFGGVAERILYDNMKAVVIKAGTVENRVLNEVFEDFALVQGFMADACRPRRPQTKGKVERVVDYVKINLWPSLEGLEISGLDELNRLALMWCSEINDEPHGTTREIPYRRWEDHEKDLLRPSRPFKPYRILNRRVSREGYVRVNNVHYSVPHRFSGVPSRVKLIDQDGTMEILINGDPVRFYEISDRSHVKVEHPEDVKGRHEAIRAQRSWAPLHAKRVMKAIQLVEMQVERRDLGIYEEAFA